MKDAATLLALAERVEALTGPDREADARVRYAIEGREYPEGEAFTLVEATEDHPAFKHGTRAGLLQQAAIDGSPRYTASLDAAMTLVPEGWDWMTGTNGTGGGYAHCVSFEDQIIEEQAANSALALTAAAIRAHAAIAGGE